MQVFFRVHQKSRPAAGQGCRERAAPLPPYLGIVSTTVLRQVLGLLGDMPAEQRLARLPDQTYRDRVTLHLGGKEIRILHLGRAHTRGDSIVFVPGDRIAFLSEAFNFDEFPYTRDSYPSDWLRTLEAAEALEADVFVPGHGFLPDDPRDTRDGLRRHRQILLDVREAAARQIEQGATEEAAAAAIDLPQYRRFQGFRRDNSLNY